MIDKEDMNYISNNLTRMIDDGNNIQYQLNSLEIRLNEYLKHESQYEIESILSHFMKLQNLLAQLESDSSAIIDILNLKM